MSKLYQSSLRVYLALATLGLWGLIAGFQLPISLFPNSSKPAINVSFPYGSMTAVDFMNTYGLDLEANLHSMNVDGVEVESIRATYGSTRVRYKIEFKWGANAQKSLRETQTIVNGISSQYPLELRQGMWVWDANQEKTGFLAISFFSQTQTLDQLYKYLNPQLMSAAQGTKDAAEVYLWNPNRREIIIEIDPDKAASLQVLPRDITASLLPQLQAANGGSMTIGLNQMNISMDAAIRNIDDLTQALVTTRSGRLIHLGDVAHVDFGTPTGNTRSIKTSGAPSLILEALPRPGGNIKKMAEDILSVVYAKAPGWPKDISYRVLVDPSEFIRSAVSNVVREVIVAACLAVLVLFLFIGNVRNVITAAIEIPLSIVLAFILMRIAHINLNLISLGGLALSAGMNVDGSVVVMENIFRHFDEADKSKGPFSFADRLRIVVEAVKEVRFPIIASTIASLVVFLPLAFTSALTNALLGDLALAVVFSHGFSAFVALILVPTVRLQLMTKFADHHGHSPLEGLLQKIELLYTRLLNGFLVRYRLKLFVYAGLSMVLVALLMFVLPKLPHELIGQPDSDWLQVNVSTRGNTLLQQMEPVTDSVEARALQKYGDEIQYTFTQTWGPNFARIMARLKNKDRMLTIWKGLEAELPNTPEFQFSISPWNPSELPIPDPPNFRVSVNGSDVKDRVAVGREIYELLSEKHPFPRIISEPDVTIQQGLRLIANPEQWALLNQHGGGLAPLDLADLARVATNGKRLWQMPVDGSLMNINLAYPQNRVRELDDLEALPVGVAGKLLPLKALARVEQSDIANDEYRENESSVINIEGRVNKGEERQADEMAATTQKLVEGWIKEKGASHNSAVVIQDAQKDLNEALHQLAIAVALSVLLIFLTMVYQFGDVVNSLLVLVAIPLGFIGVLISLFVFRSTLSLNSVLGVILLNGIAVANSIILVDFLKRLVDRGLTPKAAALEAARKRLRPILMTSMTTGLGMLPIALGFGEGGRILQPLGIAVVGGLSFSMLTTLFLVPALQVSYLEWSRRRPQLQFVEPDIDFKPGRNAEL